MGSDRMGGQVHNYGPCYAAWLEVFRGKWAAMREPFHMAEVGILKGSGLALWSKLFGPHVQINGFDMDLSNTKQNMQFLTERGAFSAELPRLHQMNQRLDNRDLLETVAAGRKFAFVIDDGQHTADTIASTFSSFQPYLDQDVLYIVEDYKDRAQVQAAVGDEFEVHTCAADENFLAVTRKTARAAQTHVAPSAAPLSRGSAAAMPGMLPAAVGGSQVFSYDWEGNADALTRWLRDTELLFSDGVVRNVACARGLVQPNGRPYICMGSDRMGGQVHNYGPCYAAWLEVFRGKWAAMREPFHMAEVGILKGSGLALWSKLFGPHVQINGFDMDLSNTKQNMQFLTERGAFSAELPRLHQMNQRLDNRDLLETVAAGRKFAFVIDDGQHTADTIASTFSSFQPYLDQDVLYIVEDYKDRAQVQAAVGDEFEVHTCAADEKFLAVTRRTTGSAHPLSGAAP